MRRVSEGALRAKLEQTMDKREKLLWFDKPDPEREFSTVANVLVLFTVCWTLFSFFWTCMASGILQKNATCDMFLLMLGIPCSLFGMYSLLAPYWMIKRATDTTYALTDSRAIEVCEGKVRTLVNYSDPNFGPVKVEPYERNMADIFFYQQVDSDGHKSAKGFFGLKDPQLVLGLLGTKVKSTTSQPIAENCDKL